MTIKKNNFYLSEPEFVGIIPERKDILIERYLNDVEWLTNICYSGTEVLPYPPNGESFTQDMWEDYIKDCLYLTNKDDIYPGKEVMFQSLFGGFVKAIIKEDDGGFYADSDKSIYKLEFDKDNRHCWTSNTGMNKRLILNNKINE
jgi:hypothetical protein